MNKTSSAGDYGFGAGYEPHTNRMLLPHVVRYAKQIGAKSAIDIGCGNGTLLRDLSASCPTVVGLDPSDSGIEEAGKNCPKGVFYRMGIYDSPDMIPGKDFDLAVSTEVIEHVFYPRELPKFAHSKLRKDGLLIVSTPYHGWLKNVAISVLGKWDSHHTTFWDGGHIKFWSRATLSRLLEETGFEVIGFHGCGRAPYLWESMILVGRKK
ncbi:MAG TPA: class I SAM-dependent methyltransferase [Roseimicrobium sp.]|nr:class I SAM-dependent methyltransferase [Roseimicrobium sp.]